MSRSTVRQLVGLDLSLRALGFCSLEAEPGKKARSVRSASVGFDLPKDATEVDKAARRHDLAAWVMDRIADSFVPVHLVAIEDYAFSMNSTSTRPLAELGGVVKDALFWDKIPFIVVPASAGRKLVFGKLPRMNSKQWKEYVVGKTREMGYAFKNDGEADAFVMANYALGEVGGTVTSVG